MITAPVAHFKAIVDADGGRIIGEAAPASGMAPCRIHVYNGDKIVAAVAATGFVGTNCRARLGWCGFSLPLGSGLFPFTNQADLVCATSGRKWLRLQLDDSNLPDDVALVAALIPTSVSDLAQADAGTTPVDGIVELVRGTVVRVSAERGVRAVYQMLLARDPDDLGMVNYRKKMTSRVGIDGAVRAIMNSEEYARVPADSRFISPFRHGNTLEALLALGETRVDETEPHSERQSVEVVRMQELAMADREYAAGLLSRYKRRSETAKQHALDASNAIQPNDDGERMARIAAALLAVPSWWGYMPKRWRRNKTSERLQRLGVFDGPAYLRKYPDVSAAGLDPLRHYLIFGRHEERII